MSVALKQQWQRALDARWLVPCLLVSGLVLAFAIAHFGLLNNYVQLVLIYVGINIILATSLNLVNGYMGEFSLAHAGSDWLNQPLCSLTLSRTFGRLEVANVPFSKPGCHFSGNPSNESKP